MRLPIVRVSALLAVLAAMLSMVAVFDAPAARGTDTTDFAAGQPTTCTQNGAQLAGASNLVDGNDTTAVTFRGGAGTGTAATFAAMTCTVDLGTSHHVTSVHQYNGDFGVNRPVVFGFGDCTSTGLQSVRIEASWDGVQWTTVFAASKPGATVDTTTSTDAQYIRTTVTDCWDQQGGIYTLSVYGTAEDPTAQAADAQAAVCTPVSSDAQTTAVDPSTGEAVAVKNWTLGDLVISQYVPPADFSPQTATDAQLEFYGFPARPTDPADLSTWTDEFSAANYTGYLPMDPTDMCEASQQASPTVGTVDTDPNDILPDSSDDPSASITTQVSHNWGGILDNGHSDYNYVYGRLKEDTANYCAGSSASSHSSWVGLGGWGLTTPLMQNGTSQMGTLGTDFAWWEALNPAHPNKMVKLSTSKYAVAAGNDISMSTHYIGGSTNPHVSFYWHNFTKGWATTVNVTGSSDPNPNGVTTVPGHISAYYNGNTAELIDERLTFFSSSTDTVGYYTQLRKHTQSNWNSGVIKLSDGANQAIRHMSHAWITMKDKNGTRLEAWNNSPSSLQSFIDYWKACGVTQTAGT